MSEKVRKGIVNDSTDCYKRKLVSLMRSRPYFPLACDNHYWDYMEKWLEEQREKNPMYLATCCWTFVSYQKSNEHDKDSIFKLSEYGRGKSNQSNMKVFRRIAKENGYANSIYITIPAYNADHLEQEISSSLPPSKLFNKPFSILTIFVKILLNSLNFIFYFKIN